MLPGASFSAQPDFLNLEPDARLVPWNTVGRLALEAGRFPPLYRSLTSAELAALLELSDTVTARDEQAEAAWWRDHYLHAGGGGSWTGCDCKVHPYSLRLQGRVLAGFTELGDVVPQEAGLAWAPGWNAAFEPVLDWSCGAFWATATARLTGRMAAGGQSFSPDEPLAWPGWPLATDRALVGRMRSSEGPWLVQAPQLLVGARLGDWSVAAGWAARRTGPGLTGTLVLDQTGETFPALTVRRVSPFRWSGVMTHAAPDNLLLRAGKLTARQVRYGDPWGEVEKIAEPWFFQWLVGWDVTSWFRTSFTQTVMATAREGTLWPDLLQINFPLIGTTWREQESGPVTDRLFAAQMEFRWRKAPWPVLPAAGGRLYWDYGGTDFLPSGPWGVIPQISLPASVAGVELVSPRWDLAFEYVETFHTIGLWYTNSGYPEGYTQGGWLLAHPLGGGMESFTGLVRVRPAGWPVQGQLGATWATWDQIRLPGTGERHSVSLAVGGRPPRLWQVTAEYITETATPKADPAQTGHWWRLYLKLGI